MLQYKDGFIIALYVQTTVLLFHYITPITPQLHMSVSHPCTISTETAGSGVDSSLPQSAGPSDSAPAEGPGGDTGGLGGDPSHSAASAGAGPSTRAASRGDESDSDSTTGLEEDEFLVEKILDYTREKVGWSCMQCWLCR